MNRFLPYTFWAGGLVLVIIGFAVGPGVPYQDPTPAMRALEESQSERFAMFGIAGLLLFVIGLLWIIARWISRRFPRKTAT